MHTSLARLVVIVTRPIGQAKELARLIQRSGGQAITFPTLEIAAVTDAASLEQQVKRLGSGDWAIFISANAVEFGVNLINRAGVDVSQVKIISIGRATTLALLKHGIQANLSCPPPASTESLLATPEMQAVMGRRIFVFRGIGGRQLLGQTLTHRGASIEYVECYHRRLPDADLKVLVPTIGKDRLNVTVTTSVDGLRNFMDIVSHSGYDHLLKSNLVVIGERQMRAARRLGWEGEVAAVEDARNELILKKLVELAPN